MNVVISPYIPRVKVISHANRNKLMPGSITWHDTTRFEIAMDGLTATMWLTANNRWLLQYEVGERRGRVEIAPGRTSWESALRRALADCETHVGAVG
jgi:hypothetical protein